MPYEIVRLGHPALRAKSARVTREELTTKKFQNLLDEMCSIVKKFQGAGIAAPQLGVNKRAIVVFVDPKNPRYPGRPFFPMTVVINPRVVSKSVDKKEDWEGDLSADIRGLVPRAKKCVVRGQDREGKPVEFKLNNDFHARVFQHEIDHLDGKFFLDKVRRSDSISELAMWKKYWKNKKI